ncbi:MAG: hypothetical protein JRI23_08680 [Deltaproteobacteria bacterium]|nr:hypothetical protein [Deltaproteobacteria bacterium]MBW2531688.1 hypothetical protein [Deltaproteobacteria bacterium]
MTLGLLVEYRWLAAGFFGLSMIAVALLYAHLRHGLGSRRLVRAAASRVGEPVDTFDAGSADSIVTLRGTIATEDKLVPSFVDGHDVAAVSLVPVSGGIGSHRSAASAAIHHRCAAMVLRAKKRTVDLVGPLEVAVGARHHWSGQRFERASSVIRAHLSDEELAQSNWELMERHGAHARSVRPGDEVLIRGKLVKQTETGDPATYREPATRWALTMPDGDRAALAMSTRRPRPSWPRRAFVKLAVLSLGGAAIAGLLMEIRYPAAVTAGAESCSESCSQRGRCHPAFEHLFGLAFRCLATSDKDCRRSAGCWTEGRCTLEAGACVARSEEHCRHSKDCGDWGQCHLIDGQCVATAESCAASSRCETFGQCSSAEGHCVALTDDDCTASWACRERMRCAAVEGECHASARTCVSHPQCAKRGRCSVDQENDGCKLAHDDDCRRSSWCRTEGTCSLDPKLLAEEKHPCVATRDEDCAKSELCPKEGTCAATNGKCRPTEDEHCASSDRCRVDGGCAVARGGCFAMKAEHCEQASKCREEGGCVFAQLQCYTPSFMRERCRRWAHGCESDGKCTPVGDGTIDCKVGGDADCRRSTACTREGRCTAVGGRCAVASDADCRLGEVCTRLGRCSARGGKCVAQSATDCRKSAHCVERGLCTLRGGSCVAANDEDCLGSTECEERDKCRAAAGTCTYR